jgi:hypothetical protein
MEEEVRMHRTGRSLALGAVIAGALALSSLPVAAGGGAGAAQLSPAAAECPTAVATRSVSRGLRGIGWTVAHGTTPQPFRVKVLDVLPDGINNGIDLIVAKVADVEGSDMISNVGGIWAGISGSPVYVGDKLLGSVSYSLGGINRIAGITPAADVLRILNYPAANYPGAPKSGADRGTIRLPSAVAHRVARAGGVSVTQASAMNRIPLVLSVSGGLSAAAKAKLPQRLGLNPNNVVVVPGSRASAPAAGGGLSRPVAGGNFAALVSYGDFTAGAIGTTTYVCGNKAIAFGHPFTFNGQVHMGASDASAVAIVIDPVFGSYKLATIGKTFGVLDQDRLTGIRATLNQRPTLIPVVAKITAPELGRTRTGETDVTTSDQVSGIAPNHVFSDILNVFDSFGKGSALVEFEVRGNRANGSPFVLDRTNKALDRYAIAYIAPFEMFEYLTALYDNGFEQITFKSVHVKATVTSDITSLNLQRVLVSKDGGPFREVSQLNVNRGSHLVIRGVFSSSAGGTVARTVALTIPANAPRGSANLFMGGGGNAGNPCAFNPGACGDNFNELLATLRSQPRDDSLVAQLYTFDNNGSEITIARNATILNYVAFGGQDISVTIH